MMMKMDEQSKAAVEKAKSILQPIAEKMGCQVADLLEDETQDQEDSEMEPSEGDGQDKINMIVARMKSKQGGYEA